VLISGRNREQERRSQQMQISRIVSRYDRVIAREISRAMNEAAKKLNQPMSMIEVRLNHAEKLLAILTRLWSESGKAVINSNFEIAKSYLNYEVKFDITTPIIDAAISSWIRVNGGQKITEISKTTMNDINKIVADGVRDGLSEREVAKLINAIAPSKSASRSQTIARTEAHGSSQGMSLIVANETDIKMVKVWLSDFSENSREEHMDVDGQTRPLAQAFEVDGEQLEYPGDPSGSAENVINCKCVIGYELA